VIAGSATIEEIVTSGRLTIDGDQTALGRLLGLLDPPDPQFAIVVP
jgi:alkyl sulfatase BDS1-like metallo-beta-lactamase superfamily hydrolase